MPVAEHCGAAGREPVAGPGARAPEVGIALSRSRDPRKVACEAPGREGSKDVKQVRTEARQQRLAAELRANLAKRKAQARAQVRARARATAERASVHQVADNSNERGR